MENLKRMEGVTTIEMKTPVVKYVGSKESPSFENLHSADQISDDFLFGHTIKLPSKVIEEIIREFLLLQQNKKVVKVNLKQPCSVVRYTNQGQLQIEKAQRIALEKYLKTANLEYISGKLTTDEQASLNKLK